MHATEEVQYNGMPVPFTVLLFPVLPDEREPGRSRIMELGKEVADALGLASQSSYFDMQRAGQVGDGKFEPADWPPVQREMLDLFDKESRRIQALEGSAIP